MRCRRAEEAKSEKVRSRLGCAYKRDSPHATVAASRLTLTVFAQVYLSEGATDQKSQVRDSISISQPRVSSGLCARGAADPPSRILGPQAYKGPADKRLTIHGRRIL